MRPEDWALVETWFHAARDLSSTSRVRFVESACSERKDLRPTLERMLRAHDETRGALDESPELPGAWAGDDEVSCPSMIGRRLGAYRIIGLVDSGGMGTVYEALRADDRFDRRVAVKLVRGGLADEESLARFRLERRALARLEHPNIARLLDADATEDGLPYLVMEFVEGETLDRWCDERALPIDARLRLFQEVCAAVHHAHRNLIVHRDIKPSNVLVTADGVPKLLDFGIAKTLTARGGAAMTTLPRLTLEYASPEQLRGEAITTASDVYSLGVTLFQLLTGRRPFKAGPEPSHDLARRICEDVPPKPSVVLSQTADARGERVAHDRGTSREKLRRRLTGDLDTIVLMALRKDPDRRYESAERLAADIQRHLDHRPVTARHESAFDRGRKFVRRHRLGVVASVLVVLALAAGQWRTRDALARERRESVHKERMIHTALGLLEINPHLVAGSREHQETERMLDEAAVAALEVDVAPADRIAFLEAIATGYTELRREDKAGPLTERVLELRRAQPEPDELRIAECLHRLGRFDEALAIRRRLLDEPHRDIAASIRGLAARAYDGGDIAEAGRLYAEAEHMLRRCADEPTVDLVSCLRARASQLHGAGRNDEALVKVEEAAAMARQLQPPDPLLEAHTRHTRGWLLQDVNRYAEAETELRRAVELYRLHLPQGHPSVASTQHNLALLLKDQGRFEQSEEVFLEGIELVAAVYGADAASRAHNGLAKLYADWGRWELAERYARDAVDYWLRLAGVEHRSTSIRFTLLGRILVRLGRPQEALELLEASLRVQRETMPVGRWERHKTASVLGAAYSMLGRFEEAEALLLDSYPRIAGDRGADHHRTAQALLRLVEHYERRGRPEEAQRYRDLITPRARESRIVRCTVPPLEGE